MDEPQPMRELTRIREERGLSQQGLADASGVNKATINQIERGRRSPNLETLEKLANALAVEMGDFFPKDQPPLPDLWSKWRGQLDLLESCTQYAIGRTEYYEQELERGRTREYGRAEPAYILAIHAMEEFSSIIRWVFDGPVGPLRMALDQFPSNVDARIADEFDAKEEAMIERISRTQRMLFDNAAQVAETEAQRDVLATKLQQSVVDIEDLRRLRDGRREAANKVSATGA